MNILVKSVALIWILAAAGALAEPSGPARVTALDAAERLVPRTEELSKALWDYSETALHERKSAELLAAEVEAQGFKVERGVAGLPTAFVATFGEGKPVIGILAEYDALPGAGNMAEPVRAARRDGVTSGHGCGHNLFGAASVTAAIAAKQAIDEHGLRGTLRVYGTPAEETGEGKTYMAKAGLFDDLDAALHWHPMLETTTQNQSTLAMNSFTVEYTGQAAHAALDPWNGRSALDAVEVMNFAVNLMREHIPPTARIHYVIQDGGYAPNVVPERAKVWYFVRDEDRDRVEDYYARILKIVEGAALATETKPKVTMLSGVHEILLNRPLQEAVESNLKLVGPPEFSEEEQEFARRLQQSVGVDASGFETTHKPLASIPEPVLSASTDAAEVSQITPTVAFTVTSAPKGVPWHSWATTASHGTSAGHKAAVTASKVLALTVVDLFTQPDLVSRAHAEFKEARKGKPYRSPLPEDQAPALPAVSND
jgi:aminobenzoyl-glutamate utilization protein B